MKVLGKMRYSRFQVILMLIVTFLFISTAGYGVSLYSFGSGGTISSSQVNYNFSALNTALTNGLGIYKYGSFADLTISGTTASTTVQNMGVISISIPAAGCIAVRGSAGFMFIYRPTSTITDNFYFGIGTSGTTFTAYNYFYAPSGSIPNYTYYTPYIEYSSGYVGAGTYTYYLNARKGYANTNTLTIVAPRISATYYPNCP